MNQTSHAAQRTDGGAVIRTASEVATLCHMTGAELAEKYVTLFGQAARSRNKDFLRKRLAWRIQELAEGGLSERALARIEELGPAGLAATSPLVTDWYALIEAAYPFGDISIYPAKVGGISETHPHLPPLECPRAPERRLPGGCGPWRFFEAQPPGYRKLVSWWILSAKKEETRLNRLKAHRRIGPRAPPLIIARGSHSHARLFSKKIESVCSPSRLRSPLKSISLGHG